MTAIGIWTTINIIWTIAVVALWYYVIKQEGRLKGMQDEIKSMLDNLTARQSRWLRESEQAKNSSTD